MKEQFTNEELAAAEEYVNERQVERFQSNISSISLSRIEKAAFLAGLSQGRKLGAEDLRVATEALEGFQLGHEHGPNLPHIRVMGDTYGWCDFCHGKVSFGPGDAEEALAKIKGKP